MLCPVMAAISASVEPASAARVTNVPRKSWNVRPRMFAAMQTLRQAARRELDVHGMPSELARISGPRLALAAASSAGLIQSRNSRA